MKVCFLIRNAFGVGGTVRTVTLMAGELAKQGHDVTLVSATSRANRFFAIDSRVAIKTLAPRNPQSTGKPSRIFHPEDEGAEDFDRGIDAAIISFLQNCNADILVGTKPSFNCAMAKYAPTRVLRIAQEHLNFGVYPAGLRSEIRRWYPKLDAVVTLTQADRQAYRNVFGEKLRVECIANAIPQFGQTMGLPREKSVISVGRLVPQKGFDLLIDAYAPLVREFPDWRLKIFGMGDELWRLRRKIYDLGIYNHAFMMGRSHHIEYEYERAALFVMSSRFEGFGMVLTEAMSRELPVISFDCPHGPSEIIQDGIDGVLVPSGNVEELRAAMRRLMQNSGERHRLAQGGMVRARDFAPDVLAAKWGHLFEDVIRYRGQRAPTNIAVNV